MYSDRFDDARWQGAVGHTDGSPDAQHVDFRALYHGVPGADSIYLSWQVIVDPALNASGDALWIGFKQQSGPAIVIKLTLNTATTTVVDAGPFPADYTIRVFKQVGTSGSEVFLNDPDWPSWLAAMTRVWTRWPDLVKPSAWWAFQMVVPRMTGLQNGLDLGTRFRMWYTYSVVLPTLAQPQQYHWPRPPDTPERRMDVTADGGNVPPTATDSAWGDFALGPAPAGSTCKGDITILSYEDIGQGDPPTSSILYALPPAANPTNTFFVRPTNNTTNKILAGHISARFWIANWGSQPDAPNNITDPTKLWMQITDPNPAVSPPATKGDLDGGHTADATNQVEFPWTLSDCQRYDFLDEVPYPYPAACMSALDKSDRYRKSLHQCIVAELSSSDQYTFLKKSYWNNMDLEHASKLRREAQISVRGVRPKIRPGSFRTVYLFVQAFNMPRHERPRAPGGTTHGRAQFQQKAQADSTQRRLSDAARDSLLPTYRVHVYRETTDSILIRGVKYPTLRPQTSFGYWVQHDGEVVGWKHRLDGAQLTHLAPNFYRLAVPTDSFAVVTTTIEALEPRYNAFSLHAGISLPHGTFKSAYKNGFGITADFEHRLSGTFSLAALLGYHRFETVTTGAHLDLYHVSGSLETFLTQGPVIVFVDAGGGVYRLNPGATKAGAHGGLNIEYEVSPSLSLGVSYRFHKVFTSGSTTTFSSIQAGGHIRF